MANGIKTWFKSVIRILDKKRVVRFSISILSLIAFVIIWQIAADISGTEYLPTPGEVLDAFFDSFVTKDPASQVTMWQNIEMSLDRFIIGFLLAMILAVPTGLLIGYFWVPGAIAKPLIEIFRPIPPIAWVPIFLVIFKDVWGPIIVILIGAFFPVLSNVVFGVKSVEPHLIDAAKTLGAGRATLFTKVIFPYTIPYLMAGVTIGLGIAWMCIVAAEMIGARGGGVGLYIYNQAAIGRFDYMFAGIVVIALLGLITVGLASFVEKRLSKWKEVR